MSTYTRRRLGPQEQYNTAGQRQDNVYTQAKHGRRADGLDRPFPNKPVSHRRPLNPRTQDSFDLCDLEKRTITKQPRGSLSPKEHNLNGTKETTGSQHPRKVSHRLPSGEVQMARAIHAKELMLQEKLWRVEGKLRERIQRDSVEAAAGHDEMKSEEERCDRGQAERGKAQTKTRRSEEHRREAVRNREMQERRQEDVNQPRRKQDQRNENRVRNTHEEEEARTETEVADCPLSKRKGNKGTHEITVNKQKVSGELNKSRWENMKEHTRGKGDERAHHVRGEAGVRPERDMHQISHQKTAHRLVQENHRGAEHKTTGESSLPPVPSPSCSSRPQREELGLVANTDASFQLLPCRICNRKFEGERLEKHVQICEKVNQSHRQVFNSYINRTKGSAIEEFWKTHSRSKTPEVLPKKNQRQNHKANTKNVQVGRLPAGTSQAKWSK